MPQAVESPSQQAAVPVVAEAVVAAPMDPNAVNKAVTSARVAGAEVAVVAAQLLPLLPADEVKLIANLCGFYLITAKNYFSSAVLSLSCLLYYILRSFSHLLLLLVIAVTF